MTEVAIIVACAAAGLGLSHMLRVPSVPALLVFGFLLGKTGFLGDPEIRYDLLILGVSVLLFFAGTELNPQRVRRYRLGALRIGFTQFIVLGLVGVGAALLFARPPAAAAYVGLALAASSTLVVVRLLQQRRQMFEPYGRTVLGVLLLQDLLVIGMLPFLDRIEAGVRAGFLALGATLVLAGAAYVLLRSVVPWLVRRLYDDDEVLLLVVLSILFLFVGGAYFAQIPIVTGAFLAGVALSAFPASGFVRLQFNPLSDFFTALFLVILGTLVTVSSATLVLEALAYAAVVLLVTPFLVTWIGERSGLSARASIEGGLLLAQTSEFSLVLVLGAFLAGTVGQDILSVIILTTVLTMTLTPIISTDRVASWLMHLHPAPQRHGTSEFKTRDHVLLLGVGRHGMPLLETLLFAGYDVMVIDDDAALISDLTDNDVPCLRGNASESSVLERVGASRARVIISMIRRPMDNLKVLAEAGDVPVIVRVFEDEDEALIREAGGITVSFSDAAADGFFEWFERWSGSHSGEEQVDDVGDISADEQRSLQPGEREA